MAQACCGRDRPVRACSPTTSVSVDARGVIPIYLHRAYAYYITLSVQVALGVQTAPNQLQKVKAS